MCVSKWFLLVASLSIVTVHCVPATTRKDDTAGETADSIKNAPINQIHESSKDVPSGPKKDAPKVPAQALLDKTSGVVRNEAPPLNLVENLNGSPPVEKSTSDKSYVSPLQKVPQPESPAQKPPVAPAFSDLPKDNQAPLGSAPSAQTLVKEQQLKVPGETKTSSKPDTPKPVTLTTKVQPGSSAPPNVAHPSKLAPNTVKPTNVVAQVDDKGDLPTATPSEGGSVEPDAGEPPEPAKEAPAQDEEPRPELIGNQGSQEDDFLPSNFEQPSESLDGRGRAGGRPEKPLDVSVVSPMGDGARFSGIPVEDDSHFFAYFLTAVVLCVLGYLAFHNKRKILALIVEGRHERLRRSNAAYRRLDNTDEDLSVRKGRGSF
ncbi:trans-golgi network integral membrane protein TGN38, putative [Ixodes scapularis]|uniref:Trans-golgi network integral membrane protein TGN38, putative n=1 Tax=Ixodes scapularis TaxID=6945 RepID=B7P879_IXOSC|nr:trans-golgi network integral membrane protein TGN38, putative [Ixodes scapularis]|eukprot:XP_002401572.1 trans-golgi network integral membrane protein TGN38, putative [Ixodes scapularis]